MLNTWNVKSLSYGVTIRRVFQGKADTQWSDGEEADVPALIDHTTTRLPPFHGKYGGRLSFQAVRWV